MLILLYFVCRREHLIQGRLLLGGGFLEGLQRLVSGGRELRKEGKRKWNKYTNESKSVLKFVGDFNWREGIGI